MPRLAVVALALGALLITGCGSTTPLDFKGKTRPSAPVDVSVYVSNQHVLVSPAMVGAGLVTLNVTNQASKSLMIYVAGTGANCTMPGSGLMAPSTTAQVTLELGTGGYDVGPCTPDGSPGTSAIKAAALKVGAARQAGGNALLQP
jgi:hypothetical protein